MSENIENINEQQVENIEEVIQRLVREVLENPERFPTEAKLILTLETWTRQGPSYDDYCRYEILAGEAREIVLDVIDEGYPYRIRRKLALIPLTLPVVVEVERYSVTTTPVEAAKYIFVFTKEGWKSVRVY